MTYRSNPSSHRTRPAFIALEGGEGSGKSSLLDAIKKEFGDSIVTTREPGGSSFGEVIRETALKHPLSKEAHSDTMLCLMFASRFDHIKHTIMPTLGRGISVVTDRFDASSYAYNVWAQSGGELDELFWGLRKRLAVVPDLYVFVDVEPEEGLRRASSRNKTSSEGNHFDERKLDFHKKVREGYGRFFARVPHIVIDANCPLSEVVQSTLRKIVSHIGRS